MLVSDCFVSIVAPLHDDADIVTSFVDETVAVLRAHYAKWELVMVDDGSIDRTQEALDLLFARYEGLRVLFLSRSFGQEIAISAGLDSVIGDVTVVMLPESDPPDLVPEMVERCRRGSGIVFGVRRNRRSDPFWLRIGTRLFYGLPNRMLGLGLTPDATHFRALSRSAVNALTRIRDRGRYLRALSQWVGYETQSVAYDLRPRRTPPRGKNLFEAIDLAVSIVMVNSMRPLRLVSWTGLAMAFANVLYAACIVVSHLFGDAAGAGWITQPLQSATMFFFLFLILAVLCEYVGRMVSESQGRPLYYVRGEQNSSVLLLEEGRRNVVTESSGT